MQLQSCTNFWRVFLLVVKREIAFLLLLIQDCLYLLWIWCCHFLCSCLWSCRLVSESPNSWYAHLAFELEKIHILLFHLCEFPGIAAMRSLRQSSHMYIEQLVVHVLLSPCRSPSGNFMFLAVCEKTVLFSLFSVECLKSVHLQLL